MMASEGLTIEARQVPFELESQQNWEYGDNGEHNDVEMGSGDADDGGM